MPRRTSGAAHVCLLRGEVRPRRGTLEAPELDGPDQAGCGDRTWDPQRQESAPTRLEPLPHQRAPPTQTSTHRAGCHAIGDGDLDRRQAIQVNALQRAAVGLGQGPDRRPHPLLQFALGEFLDRRNLNAGPPHPLATTPLARRSTPLQQHQPAEHAGTPAAEADVFCRRATLEGQPEILRQILALLRIRTEATAHPQDPGAVADQLIMGRHRPSSGERDDPSAKPGIFGSTSPAAATQCRGHRRCTKRFSPS